MYNLKEELDKITEKSSLRDIQEYVNKMVVERGFDEETPQDDLLLLMEEVGELAKAVRKTTNIKMDVTKNPDDYDIKGELADVLLYIFSLARVLDIDLYEALKYKEEINLKRTWK